MQLYFNGPIMTATKSLTLVLIVHPSFRCVSTPQDLPPVGHAAAGELLFPLLHRRGHTAAAQRSPPGQRLQ